MLNIFLLASIITLFTPSVTTTPSVITTAYSSRSDRLNGYGLRFQLGKTSLGYHRVIHRFHTPEKLERPGGRVVFLGIADLWEFNYDVWQREGYKLGLGINKVENRDVGWQVFGEANFGRIALVRLNFRQVWIGRDAFLLTIGFGLLLNYSDF